MHAADGFPLPFHRRQTVFVGYSRVSTLEQHADLQHDALKTVGCTK